MILPTLWDPDSTMPGLLIILGWQGTVHHEGKQDIKAEHHHTAVPGDVAKDVDEVLPRLTQEITWGLGNRIVVSAL